MNRNNPPVGPGAVLYDERPPKRRPCCSEGGRCLWHVTSVYEDIENGDRLYELWDGTHTVREYVHGDDLLYDGMFTPAGWQHPTGRKPTYHLTRKCDVYDTHDLMIEANRNRS
jgi:hypothetical protein